MSDLPKIKVAMNLEELDTPNLCSTAKGIKTTGDADVTNPPYTDAQLKTMADDTMAVHIQRATNQSKSLTKQENELCGKVRSAVYAVGVYVETIANKVAETEGSLAAGEEVVVRCGFTLKKKRELTPRGFELVDSGPGWMHFRVKAVAAKAGYLWRFGRTPKKGVMPEGPLTTFFTLECEIIINNLEGGDYIACQMASILPVGLGSKKSTQMNQLKEDASKTPSMGSKKPTLSANSDPYNWSDFIYHHCE
jgi:hypothetical protein